MEQLRQELGIDPVRYARVSIDNSEGTEDVYVNAVSIYDEDGKTHEFTDLAGAASAPEKKAAALWRSSAECPWTCSATG